MGKITILPEQIANKIAAGEVVQRPESVVKELLENAIDAGSTKVELIIKRAGKVLIQVIDNGEGMSEDDAIISIQKHATSKIKTYDDLNAIRTLGFRGEALSAISAVSQLEIKTETMQDEIGTWLRIDGGTEIIVEKGSFPKGTSIAIKNLFFNTPARRNFLRSDATELKHIVDTFNKIAMSYHNVHMQMYIDDDVILNYPAGQQAERIAQVFGDAIYKSLFKVEEITDYLSVTGYIGKPSLLKKNKGDQYLFINNRFVQSKQVNHAVFTAYENILEKGEYPFFILFITLNPEKIDINVHPSKLEVRFENEKDIYAFILTVVKKGLSEYDLVPNLSFSQDSFSDTIPTRFDPSVQVTRNDFSDRPSFVKRPPAEIRISDQEIDAIFGSLNRHAEIRTSEDGTLPPLPFDFPAPQEPQVQTRVVQSSPPVNDEIAPDVFLVQLQNKYILTPIKTGLMVIDQHVAHERIMYEKALHMFDMNLPMSQQLLFPKTVQLDPGMYLTIKEIYEYLFKLGFEIKFFSKNTIAIEGVPPELKSGNEEEVLLGIADEYINNQKVKKITDIKDNLAKSYSCKSAIKAGEKLDDRVMRLLIDELFSTSMPYVCPHGRPIVLKISVDEFDKRFGRT
ncbi:MAG: DNA mismatch repair endonuclease MutL [Ignavibacteriales bacterium]|nr:DNA mismatch repair endonuclease MutL [Ignavibacteriales bacterium]